ncbi:MAG: radical SAM protein [Elusimicrobiota bacterium]|jgi:radical SAM protein with 4Fe4S-binding SPASM domain
MPEAGPSLLEELHGLAESAFVPLTMVLELTHRCNQDCGHCYLPRTSRTAGPRTGGSSELGTEEWLRVLGELADAGTLFLTFTGGEVLLRKDLPVILAAARQRSFRVEVFTNASLLTARDADLWADAGVAAVGVSVYGPDAACHDAVTGTPGSFDRTLSGIRLLRKAGIPVKFKIPLMAGNASTYPAILALARSMDAAWQVDPVLTPGNDGSDIPARLGLCDEALAEAFADPLLCPTESLTNAVQPGPDDPPCSAGRTFGSIGPCGDVYPCLQWLTPAGSVRTSPFKEIWTGSSALIQARAIRWKNLKPCPSCGKTHYSHCQGTSAIERGDPIIPSGASCRLTAAVDRAGARRGLKTVLAASAAKEKP